MIKIIAIALVLSIVLPIGVYFIEEKKKRNIKLPLALNALLFFGGLVAAQVFLFSSSSLAAEETTATAAGIGTGLGYLAVALVTGMSTIGAGIAVASAASAAIGALSEDPRIMGKALIFVALAEGVALYGLLISFTILGRL